MVCRYIERGRKPVIPIPLDDTRLGLDNLIRGRCAVRRGVPYQRFVGKKKFETVPSKCSDNGGGKSQKTERPPPPQEQLSHTQEKTQKGRATTGRPPNTHRTPPALT